MPALTIEEQASTSVNITSGDEDRSNMLQETTTSSNLNQDVRFENNKKYII